MYLIGLLMPMVFWLGNFGWYQSVYKNWRESVLKASISTMVAAVLLTEISSLVGLFNFTGLIIGWSILNLVVLIILYKKRLNVFLFATRFPSLTSIEWLFLIAAALIIILTGFLAIYAPPNNWDSMTYHLARIGHWIQNESIAHYPTHILRQLYQPPAAEYIVAQLMILSGNDFFANSVQWLAMIGSVVAASLIAKQLNINRIGQIITAVFVATIPMGILQSTSTQNDYVLAFFLLCLLYFMIEAIKKEEWVIGLWASLAFAVAILTKGTAFLYTLPIMAIFGIILTIKLKKKAILLLAISLLPVMLISGGHYFRNHQTFGHVLGKHETSYNNEEYNMNTFVSNGIRNTAMHLATTNPKIDNMTKFNIEKLFMKFNIPWNDPKTTWPGSKFRIYSELTKHEDYAGNFFHTVLIIILVLVVIIYYIFIRKQDRLWLYYLISGISMFAIFCFYLKWQPWHSRLQLPIFVVFTPILAFALSKIKIQWILYIVPVLLLYQSIPYLLENQTRPLTEKNSIFQHSREFNYFNNRSAIRQEYLDVVEFIKNSNVQNIGAVFGQDSWEYPIWRMLYNNNDKITLEHVAVTNESIKNKKAHSKNEMKSIIIEIPVRTEENPIINNAVYQRVWEGQYCAVYELGSKKINIGE
ncbi:glycosyltransferase family 39 protein [bacterium]|nr:glycosyltransferase family 39 protein [bacterium]